MMNKCYSIGDLMSMYYEREFAAVEQMPITKLSSKHNRKMIKAFRIFAENRMSINNQPMKTVTGRTISFRKRIILAAIIVVLLAFVTGSVIVFVSSGFRGTVYNDNTRIFAFDVGGSPSVIEEQYMLSVVPEGVEYADGLRLSVSLWSGGKGHSLRPAVGRTGPRRQGCPGGDSRVPERDRKAGRGRGRG